MFYPLSKILTTLLQPSSIVFILLTLGVVLQFWARWAHWGRRAGLAGIALMLILGFAPVGNALILPLEQRFSGVPEPGPGDRVDGIVVLGGFEDGWVSASRSGLAVNESAERLTETVRLAVRFPEAKVVFTGGAGGVFMKAEHAAGAVGTYLAEVGIDKARIQVEDKSRNTYENALFTRDLVSPRPGERWLLITSAWHMPRAVGTFRKAGFTEVARRSGRRAILRYEIRSAPPDR